MASKRHQRRHNGVPAALDVAATALTLAAILIACIAPLYACN